MPSLNSAKSYQVLTASCFLLFPQVVLKMLKFMSSVSVSQSLPSFLHVLTSHLQRLTLGTIQDVQGELATGWGGLCTQSIRGAFGPVERICKYGIQRLTVGFLVVSVKQLVGSVSLGGY